MIKHSKVDPDTYYTVTSIYIRMVRHNDKLTIPWGQIPEQAKRFRPDIQEELMAFYTERHPIIICPNCGKQFRKEGNKKYCCEKCQYTAARERKKEAEKTPKERECKWCGKTFVSLKYNQFCNNDCRNKHESAKKQKKNDEQSEFRQTRQGHLNEKMQQAAVQGISYAELQKQETLDLVGRVVI